MEEKDRLHIYDRSLVAFGMQSQYDQCIEEMAELMVAINKIKRQENFGEYGNDPTIKQNLIEELADVFICVEGLAHFIDKAGFDSMIDRKMQKFEQTINKYGRNQPPQD